ncbi:MAG: fimbria/pilus periplasmic chaperone [Scandinavium sp.]|uniref:fimbria/pilus periplasmic chaperone n=1 Tax=Scandinavium sp. TaxID=2830653 RepID=UPI003F3381E9
MKLKHFISSALLVISGTEVASAALGLDRTRIIFDGSQKSVSLTVSNGNKQLPFLAQGWIEDEQGQKIKSPLTVLPPVQRIEAGSTSQIKVQGLPAVASLPQNRETLFYFNLREIPPRSKEPNTLQVALQTKIKMFYRPQALTKTASAQPEEQLTLQREGNSYSITNPTPYYVTIVGARDAGSSKKDTEFTPIMIAPQSKAPLKGNPGAKPVLTYINDYGGRPELIFNCEGTLCKSISDKKR